MKIPFFKRKKTAKNPEQPRNPNGTFGNLPAPARQDIAKSVQTETTAISSVVEVMKGINELAKAQDELAMQKAESLMMDNDGFEVGNEWIPIVQQILPYISPYIPALLEKYAGVKPQEQTFSSPEATPHNSNDSPGTSTPGEPLDIAEWLKRASKASPKLIKPALPILHKELEKRGIDPEEFKQAVLNISKAYKE